MSATPATGSNDGPSRAPTEPVRYEFQSYLSDDDDEAALLRAALDPIVAETYHDEDTSMLDDDPFGRPAAVQDHDDPVDDPVDDPANDPANDPVDAIGPVDTAPAPSTHSANGNGYGAMEVDSSAADLMSPSRQETPAANEDVADSSSDVVARRTRTRRVKIEVALPRIARKKKMSYELMELDSDDELSAMSSPKPRSPRRLRKRTTAPSYEDVRLSNAENIDSDSKRKRKRRDDDTDFQGAEPEPEDFDDFSADELNGRGSRKNGSHSTRSSRAGSRRLNSAEGDGKAARKLRPRVEDDDKDELQSDDGAGSDFFIVQSDIVRPDRRRKKFRKLSTRAKARTSVHDVGSDIEFETRRSGRANKNTKNMKVTMDDDDDDMFYADDDKVTTAPRTVSVREIFPNDAPQDFRDAHRPLCDTCGSENHNKGAVVHCQGCSVVQHGACLGTRSTRDQCVTKVAPNAFVMQCRFCLCVHRKKDPRAPAQDTCQACHAKGPACAAFSQRKTPKQEEQLRAENGGVDPITEVAPELINNADNVLFRCNNCHRAWHYAHLPHRGKARDPAVADPLNLKAHRRKEYQVNWLCKECEEFEEQRIDKLVAWRPITPSKYTKGMSITDFTEDELEYLVKWDAKSYNHCVWLPGAWLHGVVKPAMYKSFVKRTFGESADLEELQDENSKDSLMRWTEREAIHEAWVTPDIILDVQYAQRPKEAEQRYKRLTREEKFKEDLDRVLAVIKIYVKFEGLGYDDVVWDTPPDPSSKHWDAFLDAYREYLNGKHFQSEPWSVMSKRLDKFHEMEFAIDEQNLDKEHIEYKEQPKGLQRGKLMTYQIEGLNWMLYNLRNNINCILADEMGLGKTVQVVALLAALVQDNPKVWPFLVIVPNATCANWRREIKKWAPGLRVVAYYGGKAPQNLALHYELFPKGTRDMKAHVVIMSYDSIKDTETRQRFNSVKWAGMVIDEAQALKNDENALYKALSVYSVPFKLLLTGTPLQNNKRELFNLLQFIDKKVFDAARLDERFAEINKENLQDLHKLIQPYFLRRTKASVLTFLPTMAQIIVPVSMSVLQEKLCKSIMARNPELIRTIFAPGKLKSSERGSLNNILMQLRKCLCHPFVYSQAVEDRNLPEELLRRNLVEASSKLVLLEVMLPKLKERGHRVLIFSQFLEQLTMLEDFLVGIDLKYERLDGSQSSLEKQRRIDAFNAPDSKLFCMLLSTRAGGVGINLATADTVIILDPDWNPHQDIQALSRAHRIGQKKKVLCFQLVTVDSPEEKIMQIGRKKMALDHLLIESMDDKEGESLNDVESVLKHGAAALFGEGAKKDAITYDAAAIDKLLDRSSVEETKVDGEKSAESAFAFARVWAQDSGGGLKDDLGDSDETAALQPSSVWEAIIREREEEAQREAQKNQETLGRGGRRRGPTVYTHRKFDFEDGQDEDGQEAREEELSSDDGDFMAAEKEAESDGESSGEEGGDRSRKASVDDLSEIDDRPPDRTNSASRSRLGSPSRTGSGPPHNRANDVKLGSGNALRIRDNGASRRPKPDDASNPPVRITPINPPARTPAAVPMAVPASASAPGVLRTSHTAPPVPNRPNTITPVPIPHQPGRPGWTVAHASARVVGYLNGPHRTGATSQPGPGGPRMPTTPSIPSAKGPRGPGHYPESSIAGAAASTPRASTFDRRATAKLKDACLVCSFLHPAEWECPEMSDEIALRMALDRLRTTRGLDLGQRTLSKLVLHEKLAAIHRKRAAQEQLGGERAT